MHVIRLHKHLDQPFEFLAECNTSRVRVLLHPHCIFSDVKGVLLQLVGPRPALIGLALLDMNTSLSEPGNWLTTKYGFAEYSRPLYPYVTSIKGHSDEGFVPAAQRLYTEAMDSGIQLELRPDMTIAIRAPATETAKNGIKELVRAHRQLLRGD